MLTVKRTLAFLLVAGACLWFFGRKLEAQSITLHKGDSIQVKFAIRTDSLLKVIPKTKQTDVVDGIAPNKCGGSGRVYRREYLWLAGSKTPILTRADTEIVFVACANTPPVASVVVCVPTDSASIFQKDSLMKFYQARGDTTMSATLLGCVQPVDSVLFSGAADQVGGHAAALVSPINVNWTASIPGASWIWSTPLVANPAVVDDQTFTRSFNAAAGVAGLDIAYDDGVRISLNGVIVVDQLTTVMSSTFQSVAHYTLTTLAGKNVLSITVRNQGVSGATNPLDNPAGLLYKLTVGKPF